MQRLLEILQEAGAGEAVMPSTHLQTAGLFARAARRLTAEGFPRSGEQCRAKFKRLKASFFEALEKWEANPAVKRRPPFFQLLSRLWEQAERPSWRDRRPPGESSWGREAPLLKEKKPVRFVSPSDLMEGRGQPPIGDHPLISGV